VGRGPLLHHTPYSQEHDCSLPLLHHSPVVTLASTPCAGPSSLGPNFGSKGATRHMRPPDSHSQCSPAPPPVLTPS
jgi:hypothetical protein